MFVVMVFVIICGLLFLVMMRRGLFIVLVSFLIFLMFFVVRFVVYRISKLILFFVFEILLCCVRILEIDFVVVDIW